LTFRIVEEDESSSEESDLNCSAFCSIYTNNGLISFFVRALDIERIKSDILDPSVDNITIEYNQRVYDPIEEAEYTSVGSALIFRSSITGFTFEEGESMPKFRV